jgi:drug/metabolite transporter (DMT)-like permease
MSRHVILGVTFALAAAICYYTAYALMALEARRSPARAALRPALLGYLARRPLWLSATVLTFLGWPLQLIALSLASLSVVQPTLALGLLLLLVLGARVLDEHVGARELIGALAIIVGLAGIGWVAPERTTTHAGAAALATAFVALLVVTLVPYALRSAGRQAGMWTLALGVGASEVWSTLASKLIVDELAHGRWLLAVLWGLSAGLAFVLGLLSDMTALQRFEATRVGPIVLVAQVVIPVLLAPLLAGEAWGSTSLSRAAFLVSLAAVTAGTALLGSSRAVAELVVSQGKDKASG